MIGSNIKKIIKDRGLTQTSVAKKANYDIKAFNNLLNNRKKVTDEDVAKLIKVLNVDANTIFGIYERKD